MMKMIIVSKMTVTRMTGHCHLNKMGNIRKTKESKIRMETMVATNDGFVIAEKDLELRGPGNIMGTQQSGEMPLRITNLVSDSQLIQKIRSLVQKILDKDPKLLNENNKEILNYLKKTIGKKNIWEYIS